MSARLLQLGVVLRERRHAFLLPQHRYPLHFAHKYFDFTHFHVILLPETRADFGVRLFRRVVELFNRDRLSEITISLQIPQGKNTSTFSVKENKNLEGLIGPFCLVSFSS